MDLVIEDTSGRATRNGAQAIHRAMSVLRTVAAAQASGCGLQEIARVTGLSRPTAHRILNALASEGFVEQHPRSRRYTIGEQIPMLALARAKKSALLSASETYIDRIAHEIGEATFLTIRTGDDTLCLARRLGSYPIQVLAIEVGARRPLGASASGIAIIAGMSPEEAAATMARNEHRLANLRIGAPALEQRVADARRRGYAFADPGIVPGTKALSVAITDAIGTSLGALTVAAIRQRIPPQRASKIKEILSSYSSRIALQLPDLEK